jgi:hypothetical protein
MRICYKRIRQIVLGSILKSDLIGVREAVTRPEDDLELRGLAKSLSHVIPCLIASGIHYWTHNWCGTFGSSRLSQVAPVAGTSSWSIIVFLHLTILLSNLLHRLLFIQEPPCFTCWNIEYPFLGSIQSDTSALITRTRPAIAPHRQLPKSLQPADLARHGKTNRLYLATQLERRPNKEASCSHC